MGTIFFLILFPIVVAILLLVLKADAARDIIVKIAALAIAAASILLAVQYFSKGSQMFDYSSEVVNHIMMGIEIILAVIIIVLSIRYKKFLAGLFAVIQTPLLVWFELTKGHDIEVANNLYIDRLSMIMVLIIGIVGSLITVYALGYMKDFQAHNESAPDRRHWFFFLMFIFLSAMVGLVTSNNLIWMYFFWEITSLCSFLLIGYNGLFHKEEDEDKVATANAFRALIMNLFGGLGFAAGIVILGLYSGTIEFNNLLAAGGTSQVAIVVAAFFAFAGITKAAQMPFNSWLLGAMVAPTPTSALLHSSTMVKAGVFMVIKLAPVLHGNYAGLMVMMVGGITFLFASFAAISQSNGKRVLAYSTVANLGLIVTCGGLGTANSVWAGIMLIIFHAVTKSLLFLCVGTAEHNVGSRDIEDLDGLFGKMRRLAMFIMIGIAGMFLAPFGMLISKWATMVSFVNDGNIILVAIICFGSAATAFYWTKWLGKMSAVVAKSENIQDKVHGAEWFAQGTLVTLIIGVCLLFPLISGRMVEPYLDGVFAGSADLAISSTNMIIMCIMVAVILLLVVFFFGRTKKRIVNIYLSGANEGDNLQFRGAMDTPRAVSLRNWYMESYFGEKKMNVIGDIASTVMMIYVLGTFIGFLINGGLGGGM